MGTEYFMVRPEKKEIFSLGKHLSTFSGISTNSPRWIEYENFKEFYLDVLDNNFDFLLEEHSIKDLTDFLWELFVWCSSGPVYLDNDCSSDTPEWYEWEETGSIYDFCEKHIPIELALHDLVINNVPGDKWVLRENGEINLLETIKPFILGENK